MSSTPEVVKTHLSSGHESQGTIDTLEVCFYHKPSLILMRFMKLSYIYLINYFVNNIQSYLIKSKQIYFHFISFRLIHCIYILQLIEASWNSQLQLI